MQGNKILGIQLYTYIIICPFVSAAIQQNAHLRQKHFFFFLSILYTKLQMLLFVVFFKAGREHKKKQKTIKAQ